MVELSKDIEAAVRKKQEKRERKSLQRQRSSGPLASLFFRSEPTPISEDKPIEVESPLTCGFKQEPPIITSPATRRKLKHIHSRRSLKGDDHSLTSTESPAGISLPSLDHTTIATQHSDDESSVGSVSASGWSLPYQRSSSMRSIHSHRTAHSYHSGDS
jgi:hypothetical protein